MVPRGAIQTVAIEFERPKAKGRVPSIGSTATSTSGARTVAHLFAVVQHRGVILLTFTDNYDPVHIHRLQDYAHGVNRALHPRLLFHRVP